MIPSLAKTADKWFAKKLIKWQIFLEALSDSHLADAPTVVVKTNQSIAKALFANRIQGTTNWLAEVGSSCSVSLF